MKLSRCGPFAKNLCGWMRARRKEMTSTFRSDLPWMLAQLAASSLGGSRQGTGSRTPLETSRAATKVSHKPTCLISIRLLSSNISSQAARSDLKEPFCLPASLAVGSTLTAMSQRNGAASSPDRVRPPPPPYLPEGPLPHLPPSQGLVARLS